jgi:hypothetical protein
MNIQPDSSEQNLESGSWPLPNRETPEPAASPGGSTPGPELPEGFPPRLAAWIRTPCGRAKYLTLASRPGLLARLRLGWFVLAAALRDLRQPLPGGSPSDGAQEPGRFSS